MAQEQVWDREYRNSKLLTKENKPQSDVVRFVKFLKKSGFDVANSSVLDLGSGTGRNSFYFEEFGAKVTAIEISQTAIDISKQYMKSSNVLLQYTVVKQSIGERLPCEDNSIDIALDVTSSNSLNEKERAIYLSETHRVLKSDGYFFVKALCLEGDDNAKYLIKNFPGKEKYTYIMPELEIEERVWSKEDFVKTYEKFFKVIHLEKKTSYSKINNRSYKRNFWVAYMKKV